MSVAREMTLLGTAPVRSQNNEYRSIFEKKVTGFVTSYVKVITSSFGAPAILAKRGVIFDKVAHRRLAPFWWPLVISGERGVVFDEEIIDFISTRSRLSVKLEERGVVFGGGRHKGEKGDGAYSSSLREFCGIGQKSRPSRSDLLVQAPIRVSGALNDTAVTGQKCDGRSTEEVSWAGVKIGGESWGLPKQFQGEGTAPANLKITPLSPDLSAKGVFFRGGFRRWIGENHAPLGQFGQGVLSWRDKAMAKTPETGHQLRPKMIKNGYFPVIFIGLGWCPVSGVLIKMIKKYHLFDAKNGQKGDIAPGKNSMATLQKKVRFLPRVFQILKLLAESEGVVLSKSGFLGIFGHFRCPVSGVFFGDARRHQTPAEMRCRSSATHFLLLTPKREFGRTFLKRSCFFFIASLRPQWKITDFSWSNFGKS